MSYILFKKILSNNKLFIITTAFSCLYFIIALLIYQNNLNSGFEHGILYGNIVNNHFCDEFRYFKDSEILYNHIINEGFYPLINKTLPAWEFIDISGHPGFGNYNAFVILLALLKLIGLNTVLNFITIKLIFYPLTVFFLYKLFKIYLSEKNTLISISIFSLLPGYILTNTLLMRDNIILLFIIMALYYALSNTLKTSYRVIALMLCLLVLLELRAYALPIIIATIIFCYKNTKKIFSFRDAAFLIITILTIVFFTTYKFTNGELMILGSFSDEQMRILQEKFTAMYGSGITGSIKVLFMTLVHIFYVPPFLNFMHSGLIYLIIFSLGNILSVLTSILFIPSYLYLSFKDKDEKTIYLLKFTFYLTLLFGILLMSKDGFIIIRLSLMWTPLFILIIVLLFSKVKKTFN